MTLRKPPSGIFSMNRKKKKKIKEKISDLKGLPNKTLSDKDRIAALEEQLATLIVQIQQDNQGGKSVSDAELDRARESIRGDEIRSFPRAYTDNPERYKKGTKTDISNKKYVGDGKWVDKKGGGHVKNYTGGKSGDKYYGGGPVYPRPTKGN